MVTITETPKFTVEQLIRKVYDAEITYPVYLNTIFLGFGNTGFIYSCEPDHPWFYKETKTQFPAQIIPPYPKNRKITDPITKIPSTDEVYEMIVDLEKRMIAFNKIFEKGVEALSDYDRNIAFANNPEGGVHTSLSLLHNQIRYIKTELYQIAEMETNQAKKGVQATLF